MNDQSPSVKILIVDDNEINLMIAKRMIGSCGLEAHTVSNGKAAVEAAAKHPYSLIFLDGHMPEMSGAQCASQILAGHARTEPAPMIVALTADHSQEMVAECFEAGMSKILIKPLRLDELRGLLFRRQLLSRERVG